MTNASTVLLSKMPESCPFCMQTDIPSGPKPPRIFESRGQPEVGPVALWGVLRGPLLWQKSAALRAAYVASVLPPTQGEQKRTAKKGGEIGRMRDSGPGPPFSWDFFMLTVFFFNSKHL